MSSARTPVKLTTSFWFLFPVANFDIFGISDAQQEEAMDKLEITCYGCDKPFPEVSTLTAAVFRVYEFPALTVAR